MSASARASQTGPTNTKDSKPVVSRKFGPETGGDVVFLSSDNVLFHVHQKHLEAYAEGFPLGQHTIPSQNEIIPLSEKSSTLEIVFQFMLPQSPPELDGLEFEQLMELANASEKYVVYFARRDCALYMKNFISTHRMQIFEYAAEHNHKSLLYELAPLLVATPLEELGCSLPHDVFVPWSIYHCNHLRMLNRISEVTGLSSAHGAGYEILWYKTVQQIKDQIVKDPFKLHQFRALLQNETSKYCSCSHCSSFVNWRNQIYEDIEKMEDIKTIARKYLAKRARG